AAAGAATAAAAPAAAGGTIEQLASVGADVVLGRAGDERRRPPIAEAVADDAGRRRAPAPATVLAVAARRLLVEHRAGDAGPQLVVLAGRHAGDGDDALRQAVEIDLDIDRTSRCSVRS